MQYKEQNSMANNLYLPGEVSSEPWMGGIRHKIIFEGYTAWVVEPVFQTAEKKWFWLPEWPTAFPERNGVKELIRLGFYMVHINVFGKFANETAVAAMYSFYKYLTSLGFAEKGAFIGMSMGGLYTFRFVETHPETANCIYADAPVCDLMWRCDNNRPDAVEVSQAYGFGDDTAALENHPLSPVNNYENMVANNIPLLMILGLADTVVAPEKNGLLLADRWRKAGGRAEVITRASWGHHPHGLDDPGRIVRFIIENTFAR